MKFRPWSSVVTVTLFTTLAMLAGVTAQNAGAQQTAAKHHHYKLIDVGTFGGPNSSNAWAGIGNRMMNSAGTVIGEADTSASDLYCLVDCFLNDVFQWQNGVLTDLKGLPGNANGPYPDRI